MPFSRVIAQVAITGMVIDDSGNSIFNAQVVILSPVNGEILAYDFTDEEGTFECMVDSIADRTLLRVTHLSFNPTEFVLVSSDSLIIELQDRSEELPHIVVTSEPVQRRGDTLIFDFSAYETEIDNTIEDVLKRIPGITIDDGRIYYQSLPISRFYIEGLDLLEGRYMLITRNLNPKAIRDIQILEHHQDKKVLSDLVRPDEAAINLTLKSKVAITGTARAGIGATPLSHQLGGDIFGFAKALQFNLITSLNNFGEKMNSQFRNMYESRESSISIIDLLTINQLIPPLELDELNYNFGNEQVAGVSFLRKISNDHQIKAFAKYSDEQNATIGTESTLLRSFQDVFTINSKYNVIENQKASEGRIIYELNSNKVFVRADTQLKVEDMNGEGKNVLNDISMIEDLSHKNLDIKSNIETIFRINNRAYQWYTDVKWITKRGDLFLDSMSFVLSDRPIVNYSDILQRTMTRVLDLHSYSSIFFKKGIVSGSVTGGLKYLGSELASNIAASLASSPVEQLSIPFENDTGSRILSPYIYSAYSLERNNHKLSLSLPFKFYYLNITNRLIDADVQRDLFIFKGELDYSYRMVNGNRLNASYTFSKDIGQMLEPFHNGYIIRSLWSLRRSTLDLNVEKKHLIELNFLNSNAMYSFYYRVGGSIELNSFTLLPTSVISNMGGSQSLELGKYNSQKILGYFEIAGNVIDHVSYKSTLELIAYKRPTVANGVSFGTKAVYLRWLGDISTSFKNSVVSINPTFITSSNNLNTSKISQLDIEARYFLKDQNLGSFRLNYKLNLSTIDAVSVYNHLFDFQWKRQLKREKISLSLDVINILNTKNYQSFERSLNIDQFYYLSLRPRRILAKCTWSF